jgi:type I restriction enzyme M protein
MTKKRHERHTENIVETILRRQGFSSDDFQFQGSYEPLIQSLLTSKKKGSSAIGRPELICRLNGDANDILVVECKNDASLHSSPAVASATDLDAAVLDAATFAEDGVIHYMRGLRREFNVIGIAATGASKKTLRVSHFRCFRNSPVSRLDATAVLKPKKYRDLLIETIVDPVADIEEFAKELHEFLRDEMELSEPEKPLLVSAILLALSVASFRRGYRSDITGENLAQNLLSTVERKLGNEKLHPSKISLMMHNYGFIKNNSELHKHLKETAIRIEENVWGAVSSDTNIDLLGDFYGEFLKYSGGDKKGLGIVLTPRHITGLFVKLAGLEKDTVLLDPCAGTGGFLIAGMAEMIKKAKLDDEAIEEIKRSQLIGIEQNDRMFTLACANMLLRGDGKSNMFKGSCFDPIVQAKVNNRAVVRDRKRIADEVLSLQNGIDEVPPKKRDKVIERIEQLQVDIVERDRILQDPEIRRETLKRAPQVAILNPPYSKKADDKHELSFVFEACEMVDPGGICIAIVPMSCALEMTKVNLELKRQLLANHTLLAGFSMPEQLFPLIKVVTCTLMFATHKPHHDDHETWFGFWKDDGFKLRKNKRVEVRPWKETEADWLSAFRKRTVVPGLSVLKHVTENDEWCAEKYLEPDYGKLTPEFYRSGLREYVLNVFNLSKGVGVPAPLTKEAT